MTMTRFSNYLLNEERGFLGHRVGDVLTSLQDLQDDMENLGSRQLSRYAEQIVNQIRKIIHSQWNPKYHKDLSELQKIAVAIQKTVEDRGDLKQILPAAAQALQTLSSKLGVKVNNLDAPEDMIGGDNISMQNQQSTGPQPSFKKKQGDQGNQPQQPQGTPPIWTSYSS